MKDFVLVPMQENTVYLLCLPESNLVDCLEQAEIAVSSDNTVRTIIVDRLLISGDCDGRLLIFHPQGGRLEIEQATRGMPSRAINSIALHILEQMPAIRAAAPITNFELAELQKI